MTDINEVQHPQSVSVTKQQIEQLVTELQPIEQTKTRPTPKLVQSNVLSVPTEEARLRRALECINPDVERGDGSIDLEINKPHSYWLGVIWAIAGLEWSRGKALAIEWSRQSDKYVEEEFDIHWDSFKPNHPNPIGIGSLYALAAKLDSETLSEVSTTDTTYKNYVLLTTKELYNRPPLKWRVKGLLPDRGLASVFGPSKSGKTFLVTDLSANVALGEPFFGLKTNACPVVYVALEGAGGIPNRIKAWETYHKKNLPDTFRVGLDKFHLVERDVRAFAQEINGAQLSKGMIVIDTLSQASGGADENSSADMGRLIANANLLQQLTDSLVVLVHHTGKDARRGARGHSSLGAALDAAIEVKYPANGRVWVRDKVKDGEDGIKTDFRLEKIDLGFGADGDAITSCVALGDLLRVNAPKPPQGQNQLAVLAAIKSKHIIGDEVALTQLVKDAESALNGKPVPRAKEAIKRLIEKGHIIENGNTCKIA